MSRIDAFCADFTPLQGQDEDPHPKFKNRPSRAVIVNGVAGTEGWILWHVGGGIYWSIEEAGSNHLDDNGLDDAPDGISIWEGDMHGSYDHMSGEYGSALEGEFRDPTAEEWAAIMQQECPWDPNEWIKKPAKED